MWLGERPLLENREKWRTPRFVVEEYWRKAGEARRCGPPARPKSGREPGPPVLRSGAAQGDDLRAGPRVVGDINFGAARARLLRREHDRDSAAGAGVELRSAGVGLRE